MMPCDALGAKSQPWAIPAAVGFSALVAAVAAPKAPRDAVVSVARGAKTIFKTPT